MSIGGWLVCWISETQEVSRECVTFEIFSGWLTLGESTEVEINNKKSIQA